MTRGFGAPLRIHFEFILHRILMAAPLEPDSLLETLLQRLEDAWEQGQPLLVEQLLRKTRVIELPEEDLLQLIYSEVDVRTIHGQHPQLSEYLKRFPALSERLTRLFEIHVAMASGEVTEREEVISPKTPVDPPVNPFRFELANPPPLPPLKPPSHQQETFIADSPLGPATPPATD